jgi:hypothetical protein
MAPESMLMSPTTPPSLAPAGGSLFEPLVESPNPQSGVGKPTSIMPPTVSM